VGGFWFDSFGELEEVATIAASQIGAAVGAHSLAAWLDLIQR
jgi:hypothetical protein